MKKTWKNFHLFLLVFGSYTKNFMSVRWFGAEKWFFKLEQVLGGVPPECNCAMVQNSVYQGAKQFSDFFVIPGGYFLQLQTKFSENLNTQNYKIYNLYFFAILSKRGFSHAWNLKKNIKQIVFLSAWISEIFAQKYKKSSNFDFKMHQ